MIKWAVVLTFALGALCKENFGFLEAVGNEKYYISIYKLEFIQAYAACKRYGWTLATEKTIEESAALNDTLKAVGVTNVDYWLAGFLQENGEAYPMWMWLDSGEYLTFLNWQSGEPVVKGYNCLLKGPIDFNVGKWISANCTSQKRYICKKN